MAWFTVPTGMLWNATRRAGRAESSPGRPPKQPLCAPARFCRMVESGGGSRPLPRAAPVNTGALAAQYVSATETTLRAARTCATAEIGWAGDQVSRPAL